MTTRFEELFVRALTKTFQRWGKGNLQSYYQAFISTRDRLADDLEGNPATLAWVNSSRPRLHCWPPESDFLPAGASAAAAHPATVAQPAAAGSAAASSGLQRNP